VSRRPLAEIPEIYILADLIAPCMLIRNEITANFDGLNTSFQTVRGAVLELLVRARRTGFRSVVRNHAVIPAFGDMEAVVTVNAGELHRLDALYPDSRRARHDIAGHMGHNYEALLASVFAGGNAAPRRSLLIDGRGVPAGYNGTAEFTLGLLNGLAAVEHDWAITLMVNPGVDAFHNLARRYPQMKIAAGMPSEKHTIALRTSQPWHFSTMMELHGLALLNVYIMYDTIAWDTLYPAPRALEASWDFLSDYADGCVYISEFTRRRFRQRFPSATEDMDYVSYPSLDCTDYIRPDCIGGQPEPYLLVVGNEYDHKNVRPIVKTLQTSFPFQKIRVFGQADPDNRNVIGAIGDVPQDEIESLYANASVVVFPSFYEGFGFPMIRALSYGRPVIVRESDLVTELAGLYSGPGQLRMFGNPCGLIEQVGCILHDGATCGGVRLGEALEDGKPPLSWAESGRRLLDHLSGLVDNIDRQRWYRRDRAIRQLLAYSQ
jgi:glycosyltransferase involved in cell wall biosynthesis